MNILYSTNVQNLFLYVHKLEVHCIVLVSASTLEALALSVVCTVCALVVHTVRVRTYGRWRRSAPTKQVFPPLFTHLLLTTDGRTDGKSKRRKGGL